MAEDQTGAKSLQESLVEFRRKAVDFDDRKGIAKFVGAVANNIGQQLVRFIPFAGGAIYWAGMAGNSFTEAYDRYEGDDYRILKTFVDAGTNIILEAVVESN